MLKFKEYYLREMDMSIPLKIAEMLTNLGVGLVLSVIVPIWAYIQFKRLHSNWKRLMITLHDKRPELKIIDEFLKNNDIIQAKILKLKKKPKVYPNDVEWVIDEIKERGKEQMISFKAIKFLCEMIDAMADKQRERIKKSGYFSGYVPDNF